VTAARRRASSWLSALLIGMVDAAIGAVIVGLKALVH